MIDGADLVLARLNRSLEDAERYALTVHDAAEVRYLTSTASLIRLQRDKLGTALVGRDDAAIRWALRSVADMMKGLIDIGSSWQNDRSVDWDWLGQTAQTAHAAELVARHH